MEKDKTTQPTLKNFQLHKPNKTSFKKGHLGFKGKKNGMWKGDEAGYYSIHDWLNSYFIKKECEFCGSKKDLHWANKYGSFSRRREDYFVLCGKCHKKYDWNTKIKFIIPRGKDGKFYSKLKAKAGDIKNG